MLLRRQRFLLGLQHVERACNPLTCSCRLDDIINITESCCIARIVEQLFVLVDSLLSQRFAFIVVLNLPDSMETVDKGKGSYKASG